MSENIVTITDANFETEVIKSRLPVLLDFSANWCGPCKAIAPLLDKLAVEYTGKIKVGKLDVDENQTTAQKYRVFSIPTLLLFKEGQVIGQSVGLVSKEKVADLLSKAL
jgi:thioredoxin 1